MEVVINSFCGFINEVAKVFLEKVKYVCMLVQRRSSEEVNCERLAGVFL